MEIIISVFVPLFPLQFNTYIMGPRPLGIYIQGIYILIRFGHWD